MVVMSMDHKHTQCSRGVVGMGSITNLATAQNFEVISDKFNI